MHLKSKRVSGTWMTFSALNFVDDVVGGDGHGTMAKC